MQKSSTLQSLAKSVIPRAAFIARGRHLQELLRVAEMGVQMLQGKGSGSGWDLDSEIQAAAASIRRPNPVLLDVGANQGKWAQGMAALFPATQKMFLFEPQEACLAELSDLNLPGKIIVPSAVGERAGTHEFYLGTKGWAGASFYERVETFFEDVQQQRVQVPVTTLDEVIENEKLEFVDFAKFDIEGAELHALRGAARSFSRRAIGALSLEFGSGNMNSRTYFRDFWDLLTGYDFEISRILPGGHIVRVSRYEEGLEHFRGVSNYLARSKAASAEGFKAF